MRRVESTGDTRVGEAGLHRSTLYVAAYHPRFRSGTGPWDPDRGTSLTPYPTATAVSVRAVGWGKLKSGDQSRTVEVWPACIRVDSP